MSLSALLGNKLFLLELMIIPAELNNLSEGTLVAVIENFLCTSALIWGRQVFGFVTTGEDQNPARWLLCLVKEKLFSYFLTVIKSLW